VALRRLPARRRKVRVLMTATTPTCVRCGRPTADAFVCSPDARALADALTVAAGHAEDAEAVIARQTRYGAGSRGGASEGLTANPKRIAEHARIVEAISGWADILVEETSRRPRWQPYLGPVCAPARPGDHERQGNRCDHDSCATARRREAMSTLALDAGWLARPRQIEHLRKHPAADEAFTALHKACKDLARFVDRPADKELVGACDCGRRLYAARGQAYVTCPGPTCRMRWNVQESRDILREALRGKLFTASECARLAAYWHDRTQPQIRALITLWTKPGHTRPLDARGWIPNDDYTGAEDDDEPQGWALYLLGDVLDRLAQTPRRQRKAEGAAA
jgi:hypothetical protein